MTTQPAPRIGAVELSRRLGQTYAPTAEQVAVIEAPLRSTLVVAGAGSGKTETMTARIVWLVANDLVRPEEVLDDEDDRETVLCVNNLASRPQAAKIQLPPEFAGRRLKDLFGGSGFPPVAEDGTVWLTFGSRDFFWLKAVPDPAKEAAHG